jgi:hypothetical protein
MDAGTRRFIRERAGERCEYCRLHQRNSELLHHIEHVAARQHGGSDDVDNLALARHRCNLHKGPNPSGVDPVTGAVENLFHPRRDHWPEHFVEALALNDARRLELRQELLRSASWSLDFFITAVPRQEWRRGTQKVRALRVFAMLNFEQRIIQASYVLFRASSTSGGAILVRRRGELGGLGGAGVLVQDAAEGAFLELLG